MSITIKFSDLNFDAESIKDIEIYNALSLTSDVLEISTFFVELQILDSAIGRKITQFKRNDVLEQYEAGRRIGIWYIESVDRTGPYTYEVRANNAIALLDQSDHYGGMYTGETVQEVVASICNVPFVIKSDLREKQLYGWLPIGSRRENLAQVLFVINAIAKVDEDGFLRIEGLWDGVCGAVRDPFLGDSVKYQSKVSEVAVLEHKYVLGNEESTLFEGTAQQGDVIVFSEPMHSLSAEGFTILESGANYAKISAGSGVLSGQKYIHNTKKIIRTVTNTDIPNVVEVKDATLVSVVNSSAVADRLSAFYAQTEVIKNEFILDGHRPGNVVATIHPYDGGIVNACIKSLEIIPGAGALKASAEELIGFHPLQDEITVEFTEHTLLTGSGSWIVPSGVTEIRAVLIGGGGAGFDGEDGGASTSTWSDNGTETNKLSLSASSPSGSFSASNSNNGAGTAGKGGMGGKAGTPGKILDVQIKVTEGQNIIFSCGAGGETNGDAGGATVFGAESSDFGSSSEIGFTDIVSGIVYAKQGAHASNGGDGGNAGQDGNDCGEAVGGGKISGISTELTRKSQSSSSWTGFGRITGEATAKFTVGPAGGGGAGGSSGEVIGGSGEDATMPESVSLTCTEGCYATARIWPMIGGVGGNGAAGEDAKTFGSSGSGGGGGGGSGASGTSSVSTTIKSQLYTVTSSGSLSVSQSITNYAYGARAVAGGVGGKGGCGAAGCIILYYGVRKKLPSGPLVTADGKCFLDKYGRRIIV